MKRYILALDQGTTNSRSVLFNNDGAIVKIVQREITQHYPRTGWVEHDPSEIWEKQLATINEVLDDSGVNPDDIAAIAITNQRETTVVWDRSSGKPVCNAIVWQDRRTSPLCDTLKAVEAGKIIREKTGLIIDAYFSATKVKWILDNIDGAREKAERGGLCFGTIDSWLLYNLTGGKVHATDVSNASRTMLFNIHTLQWDRYLLDLFEIPASILPEVKGNSEVFGSTTLRDSTLPVPIAGIAGDQQASLFGQLCIHQGMIKNTYGTGCFMLMNTGNVAIQSDNNLLTTIAWNINGKTTYALEGSVFIAGALINWLRDSLGIIRSSSAVEALASSVDDTGGVYLVPAFTGLGAPYWNQQARGMITGLTRGSTKNHIARAALESIAYQTMDVLRAMEADSNIKISELRVDGGAAVNNLLMQFQSDILNSVVVRSEVTETTALGAAYMAGLAVGFWINPDELNRHWKINKTFKPSFTDDRRLELSRGWHHAVKAVLSLT